ncbi:MAG: hypothetical protein ACOYOA_07935 [Saprospiraceae bacterium]
MKELFVVCFFVGALGFVSKSQSGIALSKVNSYLNLTISNRINPLFCRPSEPSMQIAIIPPLQATNPLGFFCKVELKFDKQAGIPVRFRLGSLEYSNSLEHNSK